MARVNNFQKQVIFLYDFPTVGGLIGTLNMGVVIPNSSVVTNIWVNTITTFVGAGATVAIGVTGTPGLLVVATAIASYPAAGFAFDMQTVTAGPPPVPQAKFVPVGGQVIMTIAVANLTAGRFFCSIEYYDNQL